VSIHKSDLRPYIQKRLWLLKPMGVLAIVLAPLFLTYFAIVILINDGFFSDYWREVKDCFGEVES
jgi:hypothetical protein